MYVDAGLATPTWVAAPGAAGRGAGAPARTRKILYSPDAFGLPELCYLGATLLHRALSCFLAAGLQEDLHAERTLARLTGMFCAEDARRACRLGGQR